MGPTLAHDEPAHGNYYCAEGKPKIDDLIYPLGAPDQLLVVG
jgi:hypothetical protein